MNPVPVEIKSVSTHAAKRMAFFNGEIELMMTEQEDFKKIKVIINAWDPLNLFRSMCPPDEYEVEVEEIIHLINITKDDMDSIVYFLLECFLRIVMTRKKRNIAQKSTQKSVPA